jgi:hypothetical protein
MVGDTIEICIKEIGWEGADWIDLAQDTGKWRAVMNTVMNFEVV